MSAELVALVAALLVAGAFFWVNVKARENWLKLVTIVGLLSFLALSSLVAFGLVLAVLR